jgi:hypothetical protein
VCLCVYLPDDDLVEDETCRRNVSDKLLFITDYAMCWIEYCVIEVFVWRDWGKLLKTSVRIAEDLTKI